mgnify:CR=1 FL=1
MWLYKIEKTPEQMVDCREFFANPNFDWKSKLDFCWKAVLEIHMVAQTMTAEENYFSPLLFHDRNLGHILTAIYIGAKVDFTSMTAGKISVLARDMYMQVLSIQYFQENSSKIFIRVPSYNLIMKCESSLNFLWHTE